MNLKKRKRAWIDGTTWYDKDDGYLARTGDRLMHDINTEQYNALWTIAEFLFMIGVEPKV